jgi:hypothetical protein
MKNTFQIFLCSLIFLLSNYQLNSQNVGDSAYINVNDIYLPFNNKGIIADVNIPPLGSTGQFAGGTFLFSSGFWLSGYTGDTLWANGAASANLVEDYQAGTVGMDPNDPLASIYKVTSSDMPFGPSWQDWSDAVDLGASFYDGNGDGVYNPVDLNGNSQWDPDEDMPDLLLDETFWCVFNDGLPANQRRWEAQSQGIEMRQTIFGSALAGSLANTLFVRYRIKNTGTVADTLRDVYFSQWADADIGDAADDLSGCDTVRQGTYFYNNVPDQVYGDEVPSFMMDMLTGPRSYIPGVTFIDVNGNNIYENGIDTPLDTAVNYLGINGIRIYPGAKNIELSSAITSFKNTPGYSDPDDKDQVRNYMLGLTELGLLLDPCTFAFGEVKGGVDCNLVDPIFWFSGDPVSNVGWLCNQNRDIRGAGTAGPFTLAKDDEVEILIGYEIDRGSTPLGGITAVRSVSDYVQNFYENNFGYPIVSIEDEMPLVSEFKLEQNYPNPFNPSTKIRFVISNEVRNPKDFSSQTPRNDNSLVTLKVYDVLGNEITKLVNEELSPGEYEVTFDSHSDEGQNLSSGIYFYTLRVGSFLQSKKMIILK